MIGKILGNRYEIVEKIGGGGMAVVYKAKCNLLNRYVAVKILRAEFTNDRNFIEKFKKESQAAASLSHPNIVNIYDVGEQDDIYYIVMEYVPGKTLKEIIQERGPLSLNEIIDFSKQIAQALSHAHQNHIIHRDIKPHNILVTQDNRAKVTDFGIALAATSSTMTNAGSVIGSVHYFSPEQARGGYTDEKSDLYSLGIVMYEMATGRVPFEGDSPISVALKHIQETPAPPAAYVPTLSKGLNDIIMKLISKEQSSRYSNTAELLTDLNQLKRDPNGTTLDKGLMPGDSPTQVIPVIKSEEGTPEGKEKRDKRKGDAPPPKKKKVNKSLVISGVLAGLVAALLIVSGFLYLSSLFKVSDVKVPGFIGLHRTQAEELAKEHKLTIRWEERSDAKVEKDYVINQDISEGMTVKEGASIKLTVSLGQKMTQVPNLVLKKEIDAPLLLKEEKLVDGGATYEFNDDLPVGTIIRQDPDANLSVPEGTTVYYVVSKGPEIKSIPMPNLLGNSVAVAKATLENLKLIPGEVKQEFSDRPEGEVIGQNVEANTPVEEGTVITLTVSKGPAPIEEPGVPGQEPGNNNGNGPGNNNGNGNGNGNGNRNETTNPVSSSSKKINVDLRKNTGVYVVDLYEVKGNAKVKVATLSHDTEKDGPVVEFNVTGSGTQTYEIYVDQMFYTTLDVKF